MHDIRAIRDTPAAFDAGLARRGDAPLSATLLAQDEARRGKITAAETAQAEQNKASKLVGAAKASGDEAEFSRLRALVSEKKAEVARLHEEAKAEDATLTDMLAVIPNPPMTCPTGPMRTTILRLPNGARHRRSTLSRANILKSPLLPRS